MADRINEPLQEQQRKRPVAACAIDDPLPIIDRKMIVENSDRCNLFLADRIPL
jgi:hypothetical protein